MKHIAAYALLTAVFAFLASGAVIAAYLDNPGAGAKTMWLIVPVTLLFMVAVAIDMFYAIPRLLLRQRYFLYCLLIIGVAYADSTVALVSDSLFRLATGFPQRVGSFSNLWVWVSVFSDSMLLLLILLGLGVRGLYLSWRAEAETVRQEYAFLKKQINPHFLFNVLNNIGILAADEPFEASAMLAELRRLIGYQLRHASDSETTVDSEIAFLRTYLNLARTRIDGLEYKIETDGEVGQISVPTLLFATFVENAVKHSAPSGGRRQISVRFTETRRGLVFICENTIGPVESCRSDKAGGLGLANTLRRLELLYGSEFSYQSRASASVYSVVLRIQCLRT